MFSARGEPVHPPPPAPPEWQLDLTGPTFSLPHRRFHLFTGSLGDALCVGTWHNADWFTPHSPSLFWPSDRSWCVATEIDYDSTLVGGSARLIADVLADPALEAWRIDDLVGGSLAHDGDTVNVD
jgi:hypothetical protein